MKKITAIILSIIMALAFCACGEQEAPDVPIIPGVPNPMEEYESLEKINELTGMKLRSPGVMGVTDEKYFVINAGDFKIAQYIFSVNGLEYTLRGTPVFEPDVSGLYVDGGPAFTSAPERQIVITDEYKAAHWINIDGQYSLVVKDAGAMEKETFEGIVDEFEQLVSPVPSAAEYQAMYDSMAGSYQDRVSQRAVMEAESTEGGLKLTVHWGSSANEYTQWDMTVSFGEDGLLYYTDCVKKNVTLPDSGDAQETVEYENGEGFFGYSDGVFFWNGSSEESCQECEFERVPD